ncbi:MAG TPA: YgiT-type zinc finger protein [Anaerolineales bacterium]|nr:YgiT-type zinc finger protein [Anaerolineales bacterium]
MDEAATPERAASSAPCDECQAGIKRLHFITYFTWLGSELVMVPNFPAWVCDVCGRRDYDEKSIAWLAMLLNPDAGKPPKTGSPLPRRSRAPASRPSAQT